MPVHDDAYLFLFLIMINWIFVEARPTGARSGITNRGESVDFSADIFRPDRTDFQVEQGHRRESRTNEVRPAVGEAFSAKMNDDGGGGSADAMDENTKAPEASPRYLVDPPSHDHVLPIRSYHDSQHHDDNLDILDNHSPMLDKIQYMAAGLVTGMLLGGMVYIYVTKPLLRRLGVRVDR